MKKLISLILVIAALLSFASCAKTDINEDPDNTLEQGTTEPEKPEDRFGFTKGEDGGYILSEFVAGESEAHEVVIPSEYETLAVTAIGKDVFAGCPSVLSVVIPDSVTRIEDGAFSECDALVEVAMSKSIATIGVGAFKGCDALKSVELPWNVSLGEGAFSECESLDREIYIPEENEVMNILMVGNSFCYYYPDELFELAKAAGIKMNICNIYYSGCTIQSHYNWWINDQKNYEFFIYNEYGRRKIDNCGLEMCLGTYDWDVISIQDGPTPYRNGGISSAVAAREPGLTELLKLFKEEFPEADLYWHHFWSSQVGYEYKGYGIPDKAAQDKEYRDYCTLTKGVVTKHGLTVVPSGEAWEKARANELIGDTLCMADCHHEGEEGGGQYLNACVWFEMLTGRSCVGNPFRPDYDLAEEKIPVLQQAAHDAVLEGKFKKK